MPYDLFRIFKRFAWMRLRKVSHALEWIVPRESRTGEIAPR